MASLPDIPICILAGGTSRRFGEDKALAKLGDKPLLGHLVERVRGQTSGPIAINAPVSRVFEDWGLAVIADTTWEGAGPLAGIATAMEWARTRKAAHIITIAVDLPFAPPDFVSKLASHGAPAIAFSNVRAHPVNGLWRADQIAPLNLYLESGRRSAHGWAEDCKAAAVPFHFAGDEVDPFWNINTREDMAKAEEMLGN